MFDVVIGDSIAYQARLVALWWDARVIPERHDVDLKSSLQDLPENPGIYAVTGRHDASAGERVLYIGQATDLSSRVVASVKDCLFEQHHGGQRLLFSDIWNLTVRWARLAEPLIDSTERVLIMSHSPPFNSQIVRRTQPRPDEHDLLIMNAGRKGPLLPLASGAYQAWGWRNREGLITP